VNGSCGQLWPDMSCGVSEECGVRILTNRPAAARPAGRTSMVTNARASAPTANTPQRPIPPPADSDEPDETPATPPPAAAPAPAQTPPRNVPDATPPPGAPDSPEGLNTTALFGNDSYALTRAAIMELMRVKPLIQAAIARSGGVYDITGYASSSGTVAHNRVLSQRRADAVVRWFTTNGVPSASLHAVGRGESDLVRNADGTENVAASRRVTISRQ